MGHGDGRASATPEYLYRYAQLTTDAADRLSQFVRGTLTDALEAYARSAKVFGVDAAELEPDGAGSIVGKVLRHLGQARETDARVRITGRDFALADGGDLPLGLRTPLYQPSPATRVVVTTNAALDNVPSQAGAAYAKLYASGDLTPYRFQILQHLLDVGDPKYMKAFFQGLPDGQLHSLLAMGQVTQQKEFITLLTSVVKAMSPGDAQKVMAAVTLPEMSAPRLRELFPSLMDLYSAGVAQSVPPPGGSQDIGTWADALGTAIGSILSPLLKAMESAGVSADEQQAFVQGILQSSYVNAVFLLTAPLEPEGAIAKIVFSAAIGAVQSFISAKEPIKPLLLDTLWPRGKGPHVVGTNDRLIGITESLIVSSLIMHRPIYPPGSATPLKLTGGPADAELIKKIMENPSRYRVEEPDPHKRDPLTVAYVLSTFEAKELKKVVHEVFGP